MKAKIKEILQRPYSRMLIPEEDGRYSAAILELPGCFSQGDSPAEAYASLEEAAANWVEAALEQKVDIPEPSLAQSAGGRLLLRLPRSLHRRLGLFAERDGVSLNQYIVAALAERVGSANIGARLTRDVQRELRGVAVIVRETATRLEAATNTVDRRVLKGEIQTSASTVGTHPN